MNRFKLMILAIITILICSYLNINALLGFGFSLLLLYFINAIQKTKND